MGLLGPTAGHFQAQASLAPVAGLESLELHKLVWKLLGSSISVWLEWIARPHSGSCRPSPVSWVLAAPSLGCRAVVSWAASCVTLLQSRNLKVRGPKLPLDLTHQN